MNLNKSRWGKMTSHSVLPDKNWKQTVLLFNHRKRMVPQSPLLSPPLWDGEKISKVKVRKLMGQN